MNGPDRSPGRLPVLAGPLARPLVAAPAPGQAGSLDAASFLARAHWLSVHLAPGDVVNLCAGRGPFLLTFVAALLAGRRTLLPPARAVDTVAAVIASHGPAGTVDDDRVAAILARMPDGQLATAGGKQDVALPCIPGDRIVAVGFTSGSTGAPTSHTKTWRALVACSRANAAMIQAVLPPVADGGGFNLLATVPSQHMYGIEMAVLLPLLAPAAISPHQPLFPQDLADALAATPAPSVLVTTPVHLRAFIAAGVEYPAPAAIICATAPLSADLARAAETCFQAPLIEAFGSTETCIIGHRRTAHEHRWRLHPQLELAVSSQGTQVSAPHFPQPVLLPDQLRLDRDGRFQVQGRNRDLIEIAGKRASLAAISAHLLAVPGVLDAVAVQAPDDGRGVRRIQAAVVAPDVDDRQLLQALRRHLDPVFLPRRILRLPRLPRTPVGKLRASDLAALFGEGEG